MGFGNFSNALVRILLEAFNFKGEFAYEDT